MGAIEVRREGVEAREFFAREFVLEDLRWTAARLIGRLGSDYAAGAARGRTASGTPA
jgi:hypothetical protein